MKPSAPLASSATEAVTVAPIRPMPNRNAASGIGNNLPNTSAARKDGVAIVTTTS